MMALREQYRPTTFDDGVGQDKVIARFRTVAKRGIGGRAYYITGKSGQGKTTIARLIAAEIASDVCMVEIDAADVNMEFMREAERMMHQYGFGGDKIGRAWIVNEAHRLKSAIVTRFNTLLEPSNGGLPEHVVWLFTTTCEGQTLFEDDLDAKPFLSRCVKPPLAQQGVAKAYAKRARDIATAEGLDGQPIERYIRAFNTCGASLRDLLQSVEAGDMMD